jgi:hypothetical protein
MTWEKKRLLIWGTTYPEFSKAYFETVCTGAIDEATGKLVRIYPITLRYLDDRFRHYQWIKAEVERNTSDFRPESYRIQQATIEVREKVDTTDGWAERSRWVLRPTNVFSSLEELRAAEARDHTSLGLVKPAEIKRVYFKKKTDEDRKEWEAARKAAQSQRDMFVDVDTATRDLQFVPVRYFVDFTCDGPAGPTMHKCSVLDWGVYVLHRKMYAKYSGGIAEQKVIDAITAKLDQTRKDAYLFMGNTKAHCQNFSIVGFYYPPRLKPAPPANLPLFG